MRTEPVLAVLVCHNGEDWLPQTLAALRRGTIRPRHVLAVDTGSSDGTPHLLAEATEPTAEDAAIVDGILTLPGDTGFAAAVGDAVDAATQRWGDPGAWIWLLHDDSAPEPDCLDLLLRAADTSPSAGVLGPLAVDWTDRRLVVDAGLSTDASGHRQPVIPRGFDEGEGTQQTAEVLAMPSAGSLLRRETWDALGGLDRDIPLLREDVDYGWRVNAAGGLALCVPLARVRHVRAATMGRRDTAALRGGVAAADRRYGVRTFLANCSAFAFVLGLPRLLLLCLLRGIGFLLTRNGARARAEFAAARYLLGARAELRAARSARPARGSVRGLVTGRFARLSGGVRRAVLHLVRRRVAGEAALGRLPESAATESAWLPPEERYGGGTPVGPDALPAGALRGLRRRRADVVAVPLARVAAGRVDTADTGVGAVDTWPLSGEPAERELVFVEVDWRRIVAATVLAPPVVLFVVLAALGVLLNSSRLGLDLAGGALLPVGDLGQVWTTYLSPWHPVAGGTGSAAPVALAVLGVLGAPFAPIGGPAALAALVLIGNLPLAGLVAYAATRRLRVDRRLRAGVAAAYALLPAAVVSAPHGRLDVAVVHVLLPALLAGIAAMLTRADARWLSTSVLTALGLAVVGAFSPLAHALVLSALLIGFVALPSSNSARPWRGVPGVAIVVLLPPALLLPWLPTLFTNPALLLHGIAGPARVRPDAVDLAGLDPAGTGLPLGFALLLAAAIAVALRPTVRVLPGIVVLAIGIGGALLVRSTEVTPVVGGPPAAGFAGVPLVLAGAGLLMVVLAACTVDAQSRWPGGLGVIGGAVLVGVLAAGAVLAGGDGPLRVNDAGLAPSLAAELASSDRAVLVLGGQQGDSAGSANRIVSGRLPAYGDDALVPVAGVPERLARWERELVAGSRDAVTSAAAAGALFVVLPPGEDGARLRASAPAMVTGAPPTGDGRAVVRLTPSAGPVTVVSPEQANRAVTGKAPSSGLMGGAAVARVDAQLPDIRVRVSDGPTGRLLVLTAEHEAGWHATVNGDPVPIVPAWGHQVAVSVPTRQAEITAEYTDGAQNVLLLGQVAALLFTLLTAIPGRRVRTP